MRHTTLLIFICLSFSFLAQNESGTAISFNEEKYDDAYISPQLRGKHSFSLEFMNIQTTPDKNY